MKGQARSRRKGISSTHGAMFVITFVALAMLAVMLIRGYTLQSKIDANTQKMQELQELISSEEERTAEIEALEEYMQSDEYVEQEAKERLGFVKESEIIFKESN